MVPLFAFVMASFVIPILALMWQGVYNDRFSSHMPNHTEQLTMWDGLTEPNEKMYKALVADLKLVVEFTPAAPAVGTTTADCSCCSGVSPSIPVPASPAQQQQYYKGSLSKAKKREI